MGSAIEDARVMYIDNSGYVYYKSEIAVWLTPDMCIANRGYVYDNPRLCIHGVCCTADHEFAGMQ